MSDQIDAPQVENALLECRRLLTRNITDRPEYSTLDRIEDDLPNFVKQCHTAYKEAQDILISQILEIEREIRCLSDSKEASSKETIAQVRYWKLLLEVSFNAFVWIAMRGDRSSVRRVFKGPKYGAVTDQNIDSVLSYVGEANEDPNQFVVPLDFCSFSCISDLLRIDFEETKRALRVDFIEAKSGHVNDEMIETILNNEQASYFNFFDKYGPRGIKQMEHFFRQANTFMKSQKLVHAEPGVYDNPADQDQPLVICADETPVEDYMESVIQMLEASEYDQFAVDEIDNCLVLGVINNRQREIAILGDFDIRLFIYHSYINPAALEQPPDLSDFQGALKAVKLMDWREGFSSVVLQPIIFSPIPDSYLMDILMGRKKLMYFFDATRFVELCQRNGLNADFTTMKEANRIRSQGNAKGLVEFEGRFIRYSQHGIRWLLGEGIYHDMVYNWIYPSSMINRLKATRFPVQGSI